MEINTMAVELSFIYQDVFERNNNLGAAEEFRKLSEAVIKLARAVGDYNGKWYKVEFSDRIYNTILNIYHGSELIFQAYENMYGDWTVFYNEIPNHMEVALAMKDAAGNF